MVCEIDFLTGNLLRKFKASTRGISSISVSPGMAYWRVTLQVPIECVLSLHRLSFSVSIW